MLTRAIRFFIVIMLLGTFSVPRLASAMHNCDPATDVAESSVQTSDKVLRIQQVLLDESDREHQSADHDKCCNRPAHQAGCCHSHVFVIREHLPTFVSLGFSCRFSDFFAAIKPGPFLEGPFQPPRA